MISYLRYELFFSNEGKFSYLLCLSMLKDYEFAIVIIK